MGKFRQLVEETYQTLGEQDMPPPPAPAAPPVAGEAPPMPASGGDPSMGMGIGEEQPAPEEDMDNAAKRDADPIAYTENILQTLVSPDEGINPEMFNDFIDTFGVGLSKIRDKEGFKKFYRATFNRLSQIMDAKEELKSMFEQLHGTLKDVLSTQDQTPDNAKGGVGRTSNTGPTGPGV